MQIIQTGFIIIIFICFLLLSKTIKTFLWALGTGPAGPDGEVGPEWTHPFPFFDCCLWPSDTQVFHHQSYHLSWWQSWPSSHSPNIHTGCSRSISNASGPKLKHIAILSKGYKNISLFLPPSNQSWMEKPWGHLWLLPIPSFSTSNHQILLTPPPKSVPGPAPAFHSQCPWPTSDQNHLLAWNLPQLPDESSSICPLQSSYWDPDLIWSYPMAAQSLNRSPLSTLTVSLELRGLLKVQVYGSHFRDKAHQIRISADSYQVPTQDPVCLINFPPRILMQIQV